MAILSNGKFYGFLCSAKETGQKLANGAKEYVEEFVSGFAGHGWKLWEYVKGKWMLEIDAIRVRGQFTVFEMLVSKVRAIIGAQAITQGCGKIKDVRLSEDGSAYLITLEDKDMSFMEHDFILCQEFMGSNRKYHVEIESVVNSVIRIPLSEFEMDEDGAVENPPMTGDDIVQFGNSSHEEKYIGRHSAIYIHADESGQPAIDVLDDIYSKNWSDCIKVRMGGDLPGTKDSKGFYCVNGKLVFADDEGSTVSVINPDGSASFARGKLSWNKDGSPVFSGTILLQIDENNVWKVSEEGKNIIGNPNGKRIEIDGANAELIVYSEYGNEVTKIEGNSFKDYTGIFTGVVPTITPISKEVRKEYPDVNTYSTSYDYYLLKEGGFWVNSDNIYLSWGNSSYSYNISLTPNSTATIQVQAIIYKMENETTTSAYQHYIFVSDTMHSGSSTNVTIGGLQRLLLEKGYFYRITMKITSTVSIATPGNSSVAINWLNADIKLYTTGYAASLFANGLCLGSSPENMLGAFSYYDRLNEEQMDIYLHNPTAGYKVENKQAYIRQGGHWGLAIPIIATGRIYGNTNSVSIYIGKSIAFEGSWKVERLSIGKYKVSFPDSMKFSSADSYYVMATGYGTAEKNGVAPIKPCVFEQGKTYFILLLSDDSTPNDGDCWFEIKYFYT